MKKIEFLYRSWFKDIEPMIVVGTIVAEDENTYSFIVDPGQGKLVNAYDVDLEELEMMEYVHTIVKKDDTDIIKIF